MEYLLKYDGELDKYTEDLRSRVEKVMENYNFKVETTLDAVTYSAYSKIKKDYLAGGVAGAHFYATKLPYAFSGGLQDFFVDLSELDTAETGFDIDDPDRFWQAVTSQAVIDGKQVGVGLISGSMEVTEMNHGNIWAFNKNVVEKAGYSAATIYKLVRDYKWSLEEAAKIMNAGYVADQNQDGSPEVYGLTFYNNCLSHVSYLGGGQMVEKVGNTYKAVKTNTGITAVMDWLKTLLKDGLVWRTGSGNVRRAVLEGKTVFSSFGYDYLYRSDITEDMSQYEKNVCIVPAPVSETLLKEKRYYAAMQDTVVYAMPIGFDKTEKTKAATAFAAIAEAINDYEAYVDYNIASGQLYDSDQVDMFKNYIIPSLGCDERELTGSVQSSKLNEQMVLFTDFLAGDVSSAEAWSNACTAIDQFLADIHNS